MEVTGDGRRLFAGDGVDERVEDRACRRRVVAPEPGGNRSRVAQKSGGLVVLIFGDEFSLIVDRLGVLFDGDTDDAGETLCWVFLRGRRSGRKERQNQDTDPSRKSTIHCRVNLSGLHKEAIAGITTSWLQRLTGTANCERNGCWMSKVKMAERSSRRRDVNNPASR